MKKAIYKSTKTYGHDLGLSCCFRQWRADHSHCSYLHGYSLKFKFEFSGELDSNNWVVDFGGLNELKQKLKTYFDHKTVVAIDDPHLDFFKEGERLGVLDLIIIDTVGCEAFARLAWELANDLIRPDVKCLSAEVREHDANSAIYMG